MQIDSAKPPRTQYNRLGQDFDLGMVNVAPPEEKEPWNAFIHSTRFWVMLLGALSIYLETKSWIGEAERNLIATVSALFLATRTIDRLGEKMR